VSALSLTEQLVLLAGYGDISDGVPEAIGSDRETKRMPPPPRVSRPLYDCDKTQPVRKAGS
jgi:hypothetical protein